LDRPTQNAQFHSFGAVTDQPQILSGRDELAGGSWFGINRTGKVALLTNITEPSRRYNTSRGNLVSSFLLSNPSHHLASEDQVRNIVPDHDAKFAGFNLLLLTPTKYTPPLDSGASSSSSSIIRYDELPLLVTNHGGGGFVTSRILSLSERSCGALSNGIIDRGDAHLWPKVQHATARFPAVVESRSTDPTDVELAEHLFQLLAWQPQDCTISQRSELRKTIQVSPVPLPLSSTTTTTSGRNLPPSVAPYGTRLSTVLLVRNNGQVLFIERDIWKLGDGGVPVKPDPPTQRKFIFKLDFESTSAECH